MITPSTATFLLGSPTYVGEALDVGAGWRRFRIPVVDERGATTISLLIHDDDLARGRCG